MAELGLWLGANPFAPTAVERARPGSLEHGGERRNASPQCVGERKAMSLLAWASVRSGRKASSLLAWASVRSERKASSLLVRSLV